jgi:anti-anti-sigma factor
MTSVVGQVCGASADPTANRRAPLTGPQRFTVRAVSAGQRCVNVALHGELDAATAPVLHSELARFCADDPWAMVADMGGVTVIDPGGITALVDAHQALRARSCALTIRNPSTAMRLSLEAHALTGLVEP